MSLPAADEGPSDAQQPSLTFGVVILLMIAILTWSYASSLVHLSQRWMNEEDYTHGFLVPVFAAYLLWFRRDLLKQGSNRGRWIGAVLIVASAVLRWAAAYYTYELLDPMSLVPCLAGVVLLIGGRRMFRWAWPAVAYLVFMIPLPGAVAGALSHPLQRVATLGSVYLLQVAGIPAVDQGNVIWLTNGKIGVVEACSGLRMLIVFFAITVGATFVIQRAWWEKALIAASAIPIGVAANIIRITATGIVYERVSRELAEKLFHDLAGWLMMPVALILLGVELFLLSRLFLERPMTAPLLMEARPRRARKAVDGG